MFETLAHCAAVRSKQRTTKAEWPICVNCYYEFPLYPAGRVNKHDQIENYVGHTDFLMLGVNRYLLPHAIKRVANIPECGVFDIYTGKIYKTPKRQHISVEQRLRVKETFLVAFNRQKEIAIAQSDRKFGQIVFDCKGIPDNPDQHAEYWRRMRRIQEERDDALSKLSYTQKMIAYYDLSKGLERMHRGDRDNE